MPACSEAGGAPTVPDPDSPRPAASSGHTAAPGPVGLPRALYLHVPFCVRRCRYCDFYSSVVSRDEPLVSAYAGALASLAARLGSAGSLRSVATAYVGGGTPTMAGVGLATLVSAVAAAAGGGLAEFSSEANPESLPSDLAFRLADAGLTRVSLGVQSFRDEELARLGRSHDSRRASEAARAVVSAGLDLSCDLMCGIPLQTADSWRRSLEATLACGAGHVSCYPLTVEEGTELARRVDAGLEREPDEDFQAALMVDAARLLAEAGLARYEVASYALPGRRCAHNAAYWTGAPYLGLGPGASSMLEGEALRAMEGVALFVDADAGAAGAVDGAAESAGRPSDGGSARRRAMTPGEVLRRHPGAARFRFRMLGDARGFVDAARSGGRVVCEVECLTRREAAAEDLMLGMRMSDGVGPALLERAVASGVPAADLDRTLGSLVDDGLVRPAAGGSFAPTERGWLLGNRVFGALWDLA